MKAVPVLFIKGRGGSAAWAAVAREAADGGGGVGGGGSGGGGDGGGGNGGGGVGAAALAAVEMEEALAGRTRRRRVWWRW